MSLHPCFVLRSLIYLFCLSACTIYQSPERKTFESESPTFKVQSLQKIFCSAESVQSQSRQSRLITISEETSLWEYLVDQKSKFESETFNNEPFKKEYCLYEVKN